MSRGYDPEDRLTAASPSHAELLEDTRQSLVIRDLDGRIRYWNRGAAQLYGYAREEAEGRRMAELVPTEYPAGTRAHDEMLIRDGEWRGEVVQFASDDRRLAIELYESLGRDAAGAPLVLEAAHDVTTHRQRDEELRHRIGELAAEETHRSEFLGMLAHELRNPLAPLRTALDILRDPRAGPGLEEELREVIDRQVRQLTQMVEDLLDVSRLTHGRIPLRRLPVSLSDATGRAARSVRHLIDARGQHLEMSVPEQPVCVEADPDRLAQVFTQLLDNASRSTGVGGTISLEVELTTCGPPGPESVVVRVRDEGAGIVPERLPRVFDLYADAHPSPGNPRTGLGIGLTLVRRLVELMGGSVEAHSGGPGRGSEFRVRLPLGDPDALRAAAPGEAGEAGAAAGDAPAAAARRRVLIVDDNQDAAESLARLLRMRGHEVTLAHNGPAALEAAEARPPDVVLLDIGLPGMDGYQVASELRRRPGLEHVFLVALSGYGEEEDRRLSWAAGFNRHLTKPADLETISRLIATARRSAA